MREQVDALTGENNTLHTEVQRLRVAVESSKARTKEIWKLSCEQIAELDKVLAARDAEILQLKSQLAAKRDTSGAPPSGTSSISETVSVPAVTGSATTREDRRGRAPPIDLFSGEDPEVRLDDWLPSL